MNGPSELEDTTGCLAPVPCLGHSYQRTSHLLCSHLVRSLILPHFPPEKHGQTVQRDPICLSISYESKVYSVGSFLSTCGAV